MAQFGRLVPVFFLGLLSTGCVVGQDPSGNADRNASVLIPDFLDLTRPATAPFTPTVILLTQAGIVTRYSLQLAVLEWDVFTVCDPAEKALNFWGQREQLPREVCEDGQTSGLLFAYSLTRALEGEYPEIAVPYKEFMAEVGFDPEDRSSNKATAVGMGNAIGTRLADWSATDGWNSLGDLSRNDFRQRFEDYTGYTPVNPPWALDYPLRWQPLTQADSKVGRFTTQAHLVPFLGQIRPLLISKEEVQARQAPMPYENMNATELSGKDKETMDGLVKDLFDISANLTAEQRFLAGWWDNKLLSIGNFILVFETAVDSDSIAPGFAERWLLADTIAQYDAAIVTWKEKRRIDAVRPKSILANLYKDDEVIAYVPKEGKAKAVKAGDWEPIIPTQPHSEYPSASATLCTAFADVSELMMKEYMVANGLDKEVPFVMQLNPVFNADAIAEGVTEIRFDTMKEAGKSCGQSRLWAGVHFGPSVSAGEQLAEGIGQKGYHFVSKLAMGEIPENCWWCMSG